MTETTNTQEDTAPTAEKLSEFILRHSHMLNQAGRDLKELKEKFEQNGKNLALAVKGIEFEALSGFDKPIYLMTAEGQDPRRVDEETMNKIIKSQSDELNRTIKFLSGAGEVAALTVRGEEDINSKALSATRFYSEKASYVFDTLSKNKDFSSDDKAIANRWRDELATIARTVADNKAVIDDVSAHSDNLVETKANLRTRKDHADYLNERTTRAIELIKESREHAMENVPTYWQRKDEENKARKAAKAAKASEGPTP